MNHLIAGLLAFLFVTPSLASQEFFASYQRFDIEAAAPESSRIDTIRVSGQRDVSGNLSSVTVKFMGNTHHIPDEILRVVPQHFNTIEISGDDYYDFDGNKISAVYLIFAVGSLSSGDLKRLGIVITSRGEIEIYKRPTF